MKLKSTIKYHIYDMKNAIWGYYLAMSLIILVSFVGKLFNANLNFAGMEMATCIFLFVVGLNMFKPQFKFLIQNGVSRKTKILGFMGSCLIVVVMAMIDTTISLILMQLSKTGTVEYMSLVAMLLGYKEAVVSFSFAIKSIMLLSSLNLLLIMSGYFITSLYYKMSKSVKIIVSVIAGGFFMFGIPMISSFTNKILNNYITKVFYFVIGMTPDGTINIINPIIFSLLGFVILGLLSYAVTRKSPVKE